MKETKTEKIIIDATNMPVGRLASLAAKQALLGKSVVIVNAEKAIIIGKKADILEDFRARLQRGYPQKGPVYSKSPTALCRRAIRGMIGRKKTKGKEAYKKIRCYEKVPLEYCSAEKLNFPKKAPSFITLEKLSKLIK